MTPLQQRLSLHTQRGASSGPLQLAARKSTALAAECSRPAIPPKERSCAEWPAFGFADAVGTRSRRSRRQRTTQKSGYAGSALSDAPPSPSDTKTEVRH
jgi:hypothetical protein